MKQRFSSLDVKVIAHELNESLVSLRLANVYDLSSKILLLKFAKPNNKKQFVIDTGFRCHLTEFARTTAAAPSAFVARLRKQLKTRRLTSVAQVGTDRILELQFSDGQYRLFLEFFASGNIILTDADLKILSLARDVSEGEGQEPQRIGLQYSLENRQNFHGIPPLSKERVKAGLQAAVDKAAALPPSAKATKSKAGTDLRKSLAVSITELPPVLVDHILQSNNFDTTVKPADLLGNDALLDELVKLLSEARKTVEGITSATVCTGYIFAKSREPKADDVLPETTKSSDSTKREDLLYDDFHPFLPYKLRHDPSIKVLEFKGFNQTVDEFFSSLEGQKLETRLTERETTAKRKLEAAKADQEKRIEGLQEAQILNMRKAAAIEANVERVQEAMDAVNGLLAQGMDWVDIGKLVEREKKRQNPVAEIIALPLNLAENIMTLTLAEEDAEDEDEADPFETDSESDDDADTSAPKAGKSQADSSLKIEISLTQSPWSNAREYYDQRKTAAVKQEKTEQQAVRALKSAEQKITEDLKKGLKQEKALLQPIRKQFWFEKFIWFISSDGYLVLGGKDAQQNEMLYKRHLRKGDVYCHAELRGATSVFIKNDPKTPDAPIPPATLAQAGNLSVCASEAWDQKAGMGAWWVNAVQVSKSAPTGDFLPPGIFNISGNKNFLPPAQLLLGLGIMFRISEESKARHVKHRVQDKNLESKPSDEVDKPRPRLAEEEKPEYASDDDDNDEEEEDQETGTSLRANPLQGFENDSGETLGDDIDETTEGVSSLQVDEPAEQPKDEVEQEVDEEETSTLAEDATTTMTDTSDKPTPSHSGSASPAPGKQSQAKRGQKGKAKKIASKYKNQDEEDRAAAESLIGATAGKKRVEEAAQTKAAKDAEQEAARERRRAQHMRRQQDIAEHEEKRKVMMDEGGVDILGPDEEEQTTSLDVLVGTPLAGDEIIEAVPFCAPWNALTRVKYKAKMQPGPVKKGKAVKEVLERWKADSSKKGAVDESARDAERMWPREVELIKAIKSEEVVNCVPAGKVRVMMSGGSGGGGAGGKGKGKGGGNGGKGGKKK